MTDTISNDILVQFGENGHKEFGWSNILEECIGQFYMQTIRADAERIEELGVILDRILCAIRENEKEGKITKEKKIDLLSVLFKLIGFTRDIVYGKGEYALSYMMLYQWYKYYRGLAEFALYSFVLPNHNKYKLPYGSWKDIKYFCNYCYHKDPSHPFIKYGIELINEQLKKDMVVGVKKGSISLVAKWIPREKSKRFGWFFKKLAEDYFAHYLQRNQIKNQEPSQKQNQNPGKLSAALLKCYTDYRKICSFLNKQLDTVQIKQCTNEWNQIDPNKQTSLTIHKQKNAFLNLTHQGKVRFNDTDRIDCASHFKSYIAQVFKGEIPIKSRCIGLNEFTKEAIALLRYSDTFTKEQQILLNLQWKQNDPFPKEQTFGYLIPLLDVSASMGKEALYTAIALAIRIAEKSTLGKRILTYSSTPTWINLEKVEDFTDMVSLLQKESQPQGLNANIYTALQMIHEAIEQSSLSLDDANKMTLIILSDMQVDGKETSSYPLYYEIEKMYDELGKKLYNMTMKPPHIVFWNVRSTNGFPVFFSQPNVSCISGYNASSLDCLSNKGMLSNILSKKSFTPYTVLLKQLSTNRLEMLEFFLRKVLE